ncbi:MAG: MFS transporter [Ardenticatenaceae bacterium]|nr:MFS transporter [Ardenticatenaceae bacterium]MCB8989512.1 MFS transporter [Ardenticatenaceae bacterium]MCB9003056.1 MFS transporter [Ardenticatenaceae bacterium]
MNTSLSETAVIRGLRDYANKVRLFRRNARLYLLVTIINGLAYGIYRLLFNFYVLSLGYDEALLGQLLTTSSLVALLSALPAGYVSDRLGRKPALLIASLATSLAVGGMVIWPTVLSFYAMNVIMGMAQSLAGVTFGPFLMENSGEEERTYLFSFSLGLQTIAGFAGNWLGGQMPTWMGSLVNVGATSATAYGWSVTAVTFISLFALLPIFLLRIRPKSNDGTDKPPISPFQYARQNPRLLLKLISPMLVTSLGAGLLMPFMNVFFRNTFNSSDSTIGTLFATGSFFMGVGLLAAPPLADRFGKMRIVVATQALSIPFLALMGFAPWFGIAAAAYLIRLALMNMSNPVYQAFVMEQVDEDARATVASLVSMSWNVGWAFSPTLSGWLQVNYGFNPVYLGTIATYIIAIYLYWRFFVRKQEGLGIGD